MPLDKVRRQTIAGVVDPGAAMLVLPQSVVKRLGLRLKGKHACATRLTAQQNAGKQRERTSNCLDAATRLAQLSNPSAIPHLLAPSFWKPSIFSWTVGVNVSCLAMRAGLFLKLND